jgi:hypothetical protein
VTVTAFGQIATPDGATMWIDTITHTAPDDRLIIEQRRRYGTLRADQFDRWQPRHVGVDVGHNSAELGQAIYLERTDGGLFAVAVLNVDPDDLTAFGPAKLSTTTATDRDTGSVQLRSVAVVKPADAAAVGLGTLAWVPGDIRRGALDVIATQQIVPMLKRAADWCRQHRSADRLEVVDRRPVPTPPAAHTVDQRRASRSLDAAPDDMHCSNSGRWREVDGQMLEVEYGFPHPGSVLAVR